VANFAGGPITALGDQTQDGARFTVFQELSTDGNWIGAPRFTNLNALQPPGFFGDFEDFAPIMTVASWEGTRVLAIAEDWFEKFYVLPREIDVGLVLSATQVAMEVYNSDRAIPGTHSWTAFTNNTDDGVSIIDLPALPLAIPGQHGDSFTLEVSPSGPPVIDGTLDFQFNFPIGVLILSVPLTGRRLLVFAYRPERPMAERLEFLTDILEHVDGTEQRVALRKNPRQVFDLKILREDGAERQRLEYILFDLHDELLGLPAWHEPTVLTLPASVDDVTITVESTAYADYRVGGSAVIFQDETHFESLPIASLTATTITFTNPLVNDYDAGVEVMPMRLAYLDADVDGSRHPVNLAEFSVTTRIFDNDSDLADDSAWPTFQGKILLDDENVLQRQGQLPETLRRRIIRVDGATGVIIQGSPWDRDRRISQKSFSVQDRQALWEVRQLLHFLRGRQVSFYLPNFYRDVTLESSWLSATAVADIVNVGYTRYVRQRSPKQYLRVELVDGTIIDRTILDSAEISADVERLTVNATWGTDVTANNLARAYFLEKVRIDSDSIELLHRSALGEAEISFPVRTVLE
jgi:hypothetical protein